MAAADEQSLYRLYKAEEEIMQYLTIALTKGRLAGQTMELFEKAGFFCEELKDKKSRKLIFTNEEQKLRFFLSKGPDVPTYVEYGAADIGIVGSDIILEEQRRCHEVLDLGFGKCRMCVAGVVNEFPNPNRALRVATKFPGIAKAHYAAKSREIDIIKLSGSIELAPILGMSDVIVDIVETGSTLKENNLEVKETICDISARLIANKAAYRFKNEEVAALAEKISKAVAENK